ncbi:MAG: molybdopterin-dependent oxidoreductase, partial [Gammaproteobacteria bacterium]|nr:molybdopterin-dependent oxidoreductase [Gammaproteobacteria bacterium]
MQSSQYKMTATHWGAYRAEVRDGRVVAIHGVEGDPDPSPIAQGMLDTLDDPCRIGRPMVRRGFLERGCQSDRSQRGAEPFVALSWDEAEELVANELKRVCELHGNDAIFAGCYGWASAGRFHHAPSQVHRFLNCLGGYTRSVDTYSFAAGEVILPHVLGDLHRLLAHHTSWPSIIDHTDLVVAFGGLPLKNSQINAGGSGRHVQRDYMRAARAAGVGFVNISPVKGDVDDFLNAQWLAPVPNTDVAIMLGLAHTLVVEGLHDWQFLRSHCVGVDPFLEYLLGHDDGQPKDASWAAAISGLTAEIIRELARRMAGGRTMLSVSWSLTRQHHGEQPYWMAVTLAAMLGQIGLPGGGVGFGYAAVNSIGNQAGHLRWAALDQGVNPVESFIPVARIADMLLHPGTAFDYNGICHSYPEIRLVYWLGGNPFHHHQDINRLLRAWRRPETIIVH